ncbi:hypothetical protein GCM10008022_14620 [Paenibacillus hunanensis]|nr:hypothetical protein GCM10008022_14620 [Paenibacillus hunanensis]
MTTFAQILDITIEIAVIGTCYSKWILTSTEKRNDTDEKHSRSYKNHYPDDDQSTVACYCWTDWNQFYAYDV